MKTTRPFVLVNMAMTADGKIATANGSVNSCGSKRDLEHLYELRATADAVLVGARTADAQDVHLGPGGVKYRRLRKKRGLAEYNLRIIVSGSGSIKPRAKIFQHKFSPLIILTTHRAPKKVVERLRILATEVKVFGKKEINFVAALRWLRKKWKVRRLLCEGGGELNDIFFRKGLVDELHLTVCPKIFGGRDAPTIVDGKGFSRLADALPLKLKSMRRFGDEMYLVFTPA